MGTECFHRIVTIRLAAGSTWKLLPGGMTVVALYSVTMAGPEYFLPGCRVSRERIAVQTFLPSKTTGALGVKGEPSFARPGRPRAAVPTWTILFTWARLAFSGCDFTTARSRSVTSSIARLGWA